MSPRSSLYLLSFTFLLIVVLLCAALPASGSSFSLATIEATNIFATLPPLKSESYLEDMSLIEQEPCGPPCFQGITVGQTTFMDALSKVKGNKTFSHVQSQDHPPHAAWSTAGGVPCCQMSADADT